MDYRFELLGKRSAYQGFLGMQIYRLRFELFAGGWSDVIERDCLERGRVVAVLPYDPIRDRVVLIEQFRVGAIHTPIGPWLLEIVAGQIEPNETPPDVVHREADEEAGCRLTRLEPICQFMVSPGSSSEWVYLYVGEVDSSGVGGLHGLDQEHEDIRVEAVSRAAALNAITQGRIVAAPAIIALQWLALNVADLRQRWLAGG